MRICFIILGLVLCHQALAQDIIWLKRDWPPYHIVAGPDQNKGILDLLQQQITDRLPQFSHHDQVVILARSPRLFRQKNTTICTIGTIYTELRAKTRLYSKPAAVLPGLAVHFRATSELKQHPSMLPNGVVDLLQLAKDARYKGVYPPNRYYPDPVVEATRYANFMPQEFNSQVNAASLLLSERVDYLLDYPAVMSFYQAQHRAVTAIQSFPVQGASPQVVIHVTCNQSQAAPQIIEQINAVLTLVWQTEEYRQAMFSWLDEQTRLSLEQVYLRVRQQVIADSQD